MLGMGSGKSPRVSLRSKLQLYWDCVTMAGGDSLRPRVQIRGMGAGVKDIPPGVRGEAGVF